MATHYVAGVCNINKAEIRSRRNVGHFGMLVSVVAIAGLGYVHSSISPWLGTIVSLPLWIAATGYLQAASKFCVGHGMAGTQFADDSMKTFAKVSNLDDIAKDKAKSNKINAQAISLGIIGGILFAAVLALLKLA
jgi:hypothetical protein